MVEVDREKIFETNRDAAGIIEKYIRPASFPVAVRISEHQDLPEGTRRPLEALGHPITICQGISMARNMGWALGFLREDHACAPSFVSLGLVEAPEVWKNGALVHPLYGETQEICARTQEALPALPLGRAASILLAPLAKADFKPDIILVYGLPAQVARLVHSALYRRGGAFSTTYAGRNSCTSELVAPLLDQSCHLVVPGSGERLFAHTQDHEMCFTFHRSWLDDITFGLAATHKAGAMRFPTPFSGMRAKVDFPKKYKELENQFGIK
ncbi:MAG TPA: hypothetical protein DEF34_06335 [Desulfotomaculum sp.]|nr:MAG: hypothetical protein VR67_16750 [Peptococcaceae bacterium BRH_c8a]KJS72690.1 MAG: hypothetical protein JL56_11960 [Desulfotomaculum sp. BICA1-6]HBX23230.1 hypothetical protein [Desulfotomaculum sp.]